MPSSHSLHAGLQNQLQSNIPSLGGAGTPGMANAYGESNYEVFVCARFQVTSESIPANGTKDPLNWMLDGLVDFPYSYAAVQGLESQGMT
jgi:hypothetical protein